MIRPYKEVYTESLKKLNNYQKGNLNVLKTGREYLDSVFGGIMNQSVITIGGSSGSGKSYLMQALVNDLFKHNDSSSMVCLYNSLEMPNLAILIRDFKNKLSKSKKDILTKEFSKEEKNTLREYSDLYTSENFFINEATLTADEYLVMWEKFISEHEDKTCILTFDHIALLKNASKENIDKLLQHINYLKMKYENVIFIILSQLNRSILGRISEKNNLSAPNRSDIYMSDALIQLSSVVLLINNPYKHGISEYMKVSRDHYSYLSEHFSDEGKKVSFLTQNRIFIHVEKDREAEVTFKNIFIEELDIPESEKIQEPEAQQQFTSTFFEKNDDEPF